MSFKITHNLITSNNKQLIDFYNQNIENDVNYIKKDNDNLLLCSYNVHGWINIKDDINLLENFNNILNLLSKCNAEILILQEVCIRNKLTEQFIFNAFKKLGYVDHVIVKNGGCFMTRYDSDYLVVLTKNKMDYKKMIDVTKFIFFKRHCIVFKHESFKVLAVHLEIGKRYHHLKESIEREKIIKENANIRIEQLTKILKIHADIDIIIGDFNFMPYDHEFKWLDIIGFKYFGDNTNTTPYNRTDMIFIKMENYFKQNDISYVNGISIKCNYSDHLPVLYEISKKVDNLFI